jgi:hypothetical protein
MDVRTLSVDDARELAELRRRAYGPDADIGDDPAAAKRLHELEEGRRATSEAVSPPADEGAEPTHDSISASVENPAPEPEDDVPTEHAPRRRWWRRVPVWSIAATALVVGATIGAASMTATVPRPDVVLRVAASEGGRDAAWQRELRAWGISPDSAVAFEQYNGVGVWTASSDEGSRCIILENGERPINATCVGGGFDPILDVTLYGGMDEAFDAPPPAGSVIRFIARDGAVEVWVRERQSVEAAASATAPSSR